MQKVINFDLSDIERRLANMIRVGIVREVDYARTSVKVESGDTLTGWLRWVTLRAGDDRSWWSPEVGEQVLVVSPGGELPQGFVIGSLFQTNHPANGTSGAVHRTTYKDGAVIEYNRQQHSCRVELPTGGLLYVTARGGITLVGDVTVAGDVVADGISLKNHKHGGVESGGADTGVPK